jgi:hypothetical protein
MRSIAPRAAQGHSLDVFVLREDAERFINEIRGDDPELASYLRIEERELEAGGLNWRDWQETHADRACRTVLRRDQRGSDCASGGPTTPSLFLRCESKWSHPV